MSPTCRRHVSMSPISCQHACRSDTERAPTSVSSVKNCRLPTATANKTTTQTSCRRRRRRGGDNDINFDMQLERFDVDMGALKEPAVERIFWAWVEGWEEEARKKNCCVEEARLFSKYRGLVFNDPDSRTTFSVWDRNMEFRRGRGNGWFVVGVSADKPEREGTSNLDHQGEAPIYIQLHC